MADVNINLKIQAIDKLLDYAASGIGAVAGPMLATWKARRNAETKLIRARAEVDSLKLIANAQAEARSNVLAPGTEASGVLEIGPEGIQQKVEFQERKRQANITSVVYAAADELHGKEVADHAPDPDWTARFFGSVQDISSEGMKSIWVRILSGEVEQPGRTSLRTLDVLKNMTSEEAKKFEDICDFVLDGEFVFAERKNSAYQELSVTNLLYLEEIGLVSHPPFIEWKIAVHENDGPATVLYQDKVLIIKTKNPNQDHYVSIPVFILTRPGKELYRIVNPEFRMEYLQSLARFLRSKDCQLFYAHVIEKLSGEQIKHTVPVRVEPEASAEARS